MHTLCHDTHTTTESLFSLVASRRRGGGGREWKHLCKAGLIPRPVGPGGTKWQRGHDVSCPYTDVRERVGDEDAREATKGWNH